MYVIALAHFCPLHMSEMYMFKCACVCVCVEKTQVYCEMRADGGWTVFQRRSGASVTFDRKWAAYKNGFGSLKSKNAGFGIVTHTHTQMRKKNNNKKTLILSVCLANSLRGSLAWSPQSFLPDSKRVEDMEPAGGPVGSRKIGRAHV